LRGRGGEEQKQREEQRFEHWCLDDTTIVPLFWRHGDPPLSSVSIGCLYAVRLIARSFRPKGVTELGADKAGCRKGNPEAQNKFGHVFLVKGDYSTAYMWFKKSAAKGNPDSQYQLSQILLDGKPKVPKDSNEAIRLLLILANQGNQPAQYELAKYYGSGKVVKRDFVEAYKWCKVLEEEKSGFYVDLNGFVLGMTHEQIQEGEKRAEDWKPHETTNEELVDAIYLKSIVLKGISASAGHRMAIINGHLFEKGEEAKVNIGNQPVSVRCLDIKEKSAVILIEGVSQPKEISLSNLEHDRPKR
jgi:hypothetical protein